MLETPQIMNDADVPMSNLVQASAITIQDNPRKEKQLFLWF